MKNKLLKTILVAFGLMGLFTTSQNERYQVNEDGRVLAKSISVSVDRQGSAPGEDPDVRFLNLTVTPAFADLDISWSVNNNNIEILEESNSYLKIRALDYFANYATVTAFDNISGKTATGKVYVYKDTEFNGFGQRSGYDEFPINASVLVMNMLDDDALSINYASNFHNNVDGNLTTATQVIFTTGEDELTVHIGFKGSFSPYIGVHSVYTDEEVRFNSNKHNDAQNNPGDSSDQGFVPNVAVFTIDVEPGFNYIKIYKPDLPGKTPTETLMGRFGVQMYYYANNIELPDSTIYL